MERFKLSGFESRRPVSLPELAELNLERIPAKGMSLSPKTKNLELLARLPLIARLEFVGSISERIAQSLSQIQNCPELGVLGAKSIEGSVTVPGLTLLHLRANAGLHDLTAFAGNRTVTALHIGACLKLKRLDGIETMTRLRECVVIGGGVSSPTIDTLEPLGSLTGLRYLRLYAKLKDGDLAPLLKLKELACLDLANRFQHEDYEAILFHCKKLPSIRLHDGVFDREKGFVKSRD